jgi:hypothetical protein
MTDTAAKSGHKMELSEDLSEHSDINEDIRRMSMDTMKFLDSMSKSTKSPSRTSQRSSSVSPSSHQDGDNHDDMITPTDGSKQVIASSPKIKNIDDLEIDSDDDDDDYDDDMSLSSMTNELSALVAVTKEIERELSNEDSRTMMEAMSKLEKSPDPVVKRILGSDDREIIRRVLEEEMKKASIPKNDFERFLKTYRVDDLMEPSTTNFLAGTAALVWSIVFGLFLRVMYAEI